MKLTLLTVKRTRSHLQPIQTITTFVSTLALTCATTFAIAQPAAYPNKPIRLVVSSGAGGGLPGVVYGIINKTRYDLYRDFDAISQISASPYFLTVHPSLPPKTVKDLIAYAKANPAKLSYASTGNASLGHLATALFASLTGMPATHVPYKGVGAALSDLLSGQIHFSLLSGGSILGQVRSGKLRAMGVASTARVKAAPDLPTLIEAGVPGYAVTQWHGLAAPRGVPRPIVDRLHREVVKATQRSDVASRLALDGTEVVASSPEQFAAFLKSEREQWSKAAKIANIKND